MDKKYLIKRNTIFIKLKNKFYEIKNKIFKLLRNNDEKKELIQNLDKEKILKLYKDLKNNKVSIDYLNLEEIKILIKLADEELNILKHKLDN